MLMADNSLNNWNFDEGLPDDDGSDDRLCFDMDSFWDMIGDTPDCSEIKPEDLPVKIVPEGLPELEGPSSLGAELPGSDTCSYSFNSEASDSRIGSSESSFDSAAKSVLNFDSAKQNLAQNGSPVHSLSGGLVNWISQQPYCYNGQDIQYELPNFPSASSFTAGDSYHVSDVRVTLDPNHVKGKTEFELRCLNSNSDSRCMYNSMEKSDIAHGTYGEIGENSFQTLRAPNIEESMVNPELSGVELPDLEISSALDFYNQYSHTQYSIGAESPLYFGPTSRQCHTENFGAQYVTNNVERMVNTKDEEGKLPPKGAMYFENQVERSGGAVSPVSAMWNANVSGPNDFGLAVGNMSSTQILGHSLSNMSSMNQGVHMKDEKNDEVYASQGTECPSFMAIDGLSSKKQAFDVKNEKDKLFASQGNGYQSFVDVNNVACWKPSGGFDSFSSKKQALHVKDEKNVNGSRRARHSLIKDEKICKINSPVAESRFLDVQASEQKPCFQQSKSISSRLLGPKLEDRENKLTQSKSVVGSQHIKVSHQTLDDDDDVCILEDLSEPAHRTQSAVNVKSHIASRISSLIDSRNRFEVDGVRLKTNDERIIYRAALQDLSQPKSEATPPDGFLSVPLLRHQRIALSWMVQKETSSIQPCSGGILADDQGLGKTISTIALILKERSPSSRMSTITSNQMETLDLDDDDGVTELNGTSQTMADRILATGRDPPVQAKGRPAAGTLIVCPTSVLRQWSDELHNKVTSEANLSVLTYHGGNRTKDPLELAKYDVVLTTYAIVSMEVPKQPLVDKDDDERRKRSHTPPTGHPSTKKRKYPPNSDKRSSKSKKGGDDELLESSISRPLAQVRWFRVVLDEAQSIKNYRTQVARACWGLRAKRRWCLSGTPIQNAIDDLYSYFRFLKYDPYAVFKSFCSTIKVPIQKNPTNGYRKLQAVLKTIMLRRTKGTLLDGEPIINLPPKTIELKKVEFTLEERDFYCKLEADSRAQFAEYAAAGTVKQNYVNILLMLLRLRQACDHPLLVRGCGSDTMWTSSAEVAKKLPPEKLASLLNCLEASLAICGICNDAPEDAVVTSCGHVFCNQCICEHLTGDDNQCPTPNCKVRLSVSSVFARATLKNTLSEGHEIAADCYGSVLAETPQPCSAVGLFDSSKIKAALEVLQSLSRPRDLMSRASSLINIDGGASCPENRDVCNKQIVDMDSDRKSLVPVVGEKAIVFSQWTRMLDLLEASLKDSSINYRRLDGTMSVVARDKAVKDFNTQPEVSVMIMSLKAASLGLNMVAACHVILLDLWWNPTTEDQAIDRAHRIGQTRPVSVFRLTVKDTVEDRILALQQKKREMVSSAFGEDETGSRQTRLTVEDLNYLFMHN